MSERTKATMETPRAILNIAGLASITIGFYRLLTSLAVDDFYLYWFLALFVWRYLRFVVNLVAFWCYSPSPRPGRPSYVPCRDVTAVIPTVGPEQAFFRETIMACAANAPAKIVIVAAGDDIFDKTLGFLSEIRHAYPQTQFVVKKTQVASKRCQIALAVPHIKTDIAVLLDDHVFWGPRFLESLLAAFEDPSVGLVGTNKRVRRLEGLNLWRRIWNMLGAAYLCRHNFELRATNTMDGGVFVVSGRTCALRTEILQHPEFLPGYTNERFFFGLFGPLNPDDDNYNTRFAVRHGWKIKIQYTDDALMETTLGVEDPVCTKFLGQCRRWARTTWRSNLCSLVTDRSVWSCQPYCVYAVYLTSLTNFSALTDPLLIYLFVYSRAYAASPWAVAGLVGWILFAKVVKVFDYFRRHPQDIPLFPAYLAFAYYHSLIKLWALLTFWDYTWSGRNLEQIQVDPAVPDTATTTPSPQPQRGTGSHRSITALFRSLRTRIADLRAQQMQHMARYQLPLLSEMLLLQGALPRRRDAPGYGTVVKNHGVTRKRSSNSQRECP
jgi:cellulose synthase/poly-beta-1,6-N-acetylglucosamine synthase-like glycosyltransferase